MKLVKKILPFLILILFSACEDKPQQPSEEEAVAFAKQIERSMMKKDGSVLDNGFDAGIFIERMHLPDAKNAKGFAKGNAANMQLGTRILSEHTAKLNFEFIKHYIKEGKHHIIFRFYDDQGGSLNYHDYELVKKGGKCRIVDGYMYNIGQTLSETVGDLFKAIYEGSHGDDDAASVDFDHINLVRMLMQQAKGEEAKKKYEALPDYIKKSKTAKLLDISICSNLSTEQFETAIGEYKNAFPNEPGVNLVMMNGYFLQKKYTKMLAAINALDSQINKDPFLDFFRYQGYYLLKDKPNTRLYLTRFVKNEPELQLGYQELISLDLQEKKKIEADSLVAVYRQKKFNEEELKELIRYFQ